jgi:hypothetical protein
MNLKFDTPAKLILSLSIVLYNMAYSQNYLNTDRQKVRQQLIKYYTAYKYKTILQETDSSIIIQTRDSTVLPFDFIVHFNQADISYAYQNISYCDSCMHKSLQYTLSSRKAGWQKITDSFYVSKYLQKMALTVNSAESKFSYTITAMDWNREEYKTAQQASNSIQWIEGYRLQQPGEYQPDTTNVIIWFAKRLLWADFKEEVFTDVYRGADAKTNCGFRHNIGNIYKDSGNTKLAVTIYALFYPSYSWVRPENIGKRELLIDEQLHFDIAELVARQLRQQLAEMQLDRNTCRKEINKAANKAYSRMMQM